LSLNWTALAVTGLSPEAASRCDGTSFAQAAIRHGVAVLPGAGLDLTGAGEDHIRLYFRLPADIQAEAVRRLAAAWRTYRPPVTRVPASPALAF
jgi:aspartate/methionine/tyrosine aminotransferase